MRILAAFFALLCCLSSPAWAGLPPAQIGIVVMHGKGGAPTKLVDSSTPFIRGRLGPSGARARELVAGGRADERGSFDDFENAKGLYPIETTAAKYLAWFDPAGAMNQGAAIEAVKPATPVLYIVPTGDYPGLLRVKDEHFSRLPRNPLTRLHEPAATHTTAPWESREEIARWLGEVAR